MGSWNDLIDPVIARQESRRKMSKPSSQQERQRIARVQMTDGLLAWASKDNADAIVGYCVNLRLGAADSVELALIDMWRAMNRIEKELSDKPQDWRSPEGVPCGLCPVFFCCHKPDPEKSEPETRMNFSWIERHRTFESHRREGAPVSRRGVCPVYADLVMILKEELRWEVARERCPRPEQSIELDDNKVSGTWVRPCSNLGDNLRESADRVEAPKVKRPAHKMARYWRANAGLWEVAGLPPCTLREWFGRTQRNREALVQLLDGTTDVNERQMAISSQTEWLEEDGQLNEAKTLKYPPVEASSDTLSDTLRSVAQSVKDNSLTRCLYALATWNDIYPEPTVIQLLGKSHRQWLRTVLMTDAEKVEELCTRVRELDEEVQFSGAEDGEVQS